MTTDPKDQLVSYDDYIRRLADEIDRLAGKGEPVVVDPEIADHMGAFEEDALSAEDALDSNDFAEEGGFNG